MKKVVILGCENSHADMFLGYIAEGGYPDIEITGVFSEDRAAAEKLGQTFGVHVMDRYDEAVGQVDGVIVTARHGDLHYKFAAPYIASGAAMFIDKPITISEAEAVEFMQKLRDADVRITGGSCCKYIDYIQQLKSEHQNEVNGKTLGGFMRAPVSVDNPHGGFFFYSQHLVEMVLEVYGHYPKSVAVFENSGKITVVFRYADFDITAQYVVGNFYYYAARYAEKACAGQQVEVLASSPCFRAEFDEFYRILEGGAQAQSYEDFIAPVFVLNAIFRAMESGKEEPVREYTI